jgi:hypothetical protein
MTGLNLGMAIELAVAGLLVLTIAYCTILNRRLIRLRSDEAVLRATIAELITATEIAERAVMSLKATADDCELSLGARLLKAEAATAELDRGIAEGGEIVRRIGAIVGASMPAGEAARATSPVAPPLPPQPREPTARTLQAAAQEAAERLANYRRGAREVA